MVYCIGSRQGRINVARGRWQILARGPQPLPLLWEPLNSKTHKIVK
jgi:hypothetical protein